MRLTSMDISLAASPARQITCEGTFMGKCVWQMLAYGWAHAHAELDTHIHTSHTHIMYKPYPHATLSTCCTPRSPFFAAEEKLTCGVLTTIKECPSQTSPSHTTLNPVPSMYPITDTILVAPHHTESAPHPHHTSLSPTKLSQKWQTSLFLSGLDSLHHITKALVCNIAALSARCCRTWCSNWGKLLRS